MARPPATPRPPRRRRPPAPPTPPPPPQAPAEPQPARGRSNLGRALGVAIAVASAAGVGVGIKQSATPPPVAAACGGTERWDVKGANDADASQIQLNPLQATVGTLNDTLRPGPMDAGGRMAAEKQTYAIQGYIAFFKHEADGDYHVVITDTPTAPFSSGRTDPPQGHSLVVELPDPGCFAGHGGKGPRTSLLDQQITEARADFEKQVAQHHEGLQAARIPVTVTGVAFYDFDHGQVGRAKPYPLLDAHGKQLAKQDKVIELHPVTGMIFDNAKPD